MAEETAGRKARLREIEDGLRATGAARRFRSVKSHACRIRCCDCGKPEVRGVQAKRCRECQGQRDRERRVHAQRKGRLLAAGLVAEQTQGIFRVLVAVKGVCRQCGEEFPRRRTTARYCSTRCRMAAHRGKK